MHTDRINEFSAEQKRRISSNPDNAALISAAKAFNLESNRAKYSYNFSWMGRPIIQYPQDIMAMQELVWELKPDLIIETGIAHGGSLIFYASLLELIGKGEVVGIDIDIRSHNRAEIERHPMFKRIRMIEGSSIDPDIALQVGHLASEMKTVLVSLDSNHTHEHVAKELELYGPMVSVNSYMVVFDTIVEELPDGYLPGRPWTRKNNPKTAVNEFLNRNNHFVVDHDIDKKLLISVAPGGYLKKINR